MTNTATTRRVKPKPKTPLKQKSEPSVFAQKETAYDFFVRKLVARTLDALKSPNAIPSSILLSAFEEVRQFPSNKK